MFRHKEFGSECICLYLCRISCLRGFAIAEASQVVYAELAIGVQVQVPEFMSKGETLAIGVVKGIDTYDDS